MRPSELKKGVRVRVARLEWTRGMVVDHRHLAVRAVNKVGAVIGKVPGSAGDDWLVQHDDNPAEIGAYCFTELQPVA